MADLENAGTPEFEIDKVRAPFADVKPRNLAAEAREKVGQLIKPSGNDFQLLKQETPHIRMPMMQMLFDEFQLRTHTIKRQVPERIAQGGYPVDAIYLSIMTTIQDCIASLQENNPEFRDLLAQCKALFALTEYKMKGGSAAQDFLNIINQGIHVLIGLFEAIPDVYLLKHHQIAQKDELKNLIPSSTKRLISGLTRMSGPYATRVEAMIGYHPREFTEGKYVDLRRAVFYPDNLILRDTNDGEMLDVSDTVTAMVQRTTRVGDPSYYGCLGGLARMKPEKGQEPHKAPTIFAFVENLVVELMEEHWYKTIAADA